MFGSFGTFGEETFTWTMMGAREVLRSWAGWLMVSASSTTSCSERANSKILSISLCTSAEGRGTCEMNKTDSEQLLESIVLFFILLWRHSDVFSWRLVEVSSGVLVPKLERVLDLSMMALLLGLFRTDLLAKEISAVTRVIDILGHEERQSTPF